MSNKKNNNGTFNGMRAVRFPPIKQNGISPGSYEPQKVRYFNDMLEQKPHSIHGVCETLDSRFKNTKQNHTVAPCDHNQSKSLILDPIKIIDMNKKSPRYDFGSKSTTPPPNAYDINYATGRYASNNYKFQLLKSDEHKQRDELNKVQLDTVKHLLKLDNIFTDKRTCRRIAHFALYFPQKRLKEKHEE